MMETNGIDNIELFEPQIIAFSFDTIGWKLLFGISLAVILFIIGLRLKSYYKNRYRREAAKALNKLEKQSLEAVQLIQQLAILLKQTAMHRYGRDAVAAASGSDWLHFVQNKCSGIDMNDLKLIFEANYNERLATNVTVDQQKHLIQTIKYWIKRHA